MKKEHVTDVRETDSQWRYYQWNDDTSWHYFRYEPIKWRVLQVNGEKIFLRANTCLDRQKYHETDMPAIWEESSIRNWLNSDLMDSAFSDPEKQAVADTLVKNDPDPISGKPGGNDTTDKIFLLSAAEATDASYGSAEGDPNRCIRYPSAYAQAMGLGVWKGVGAGAEAYHDDVVWYLRSPSEDPGSNGPACINMDGSVIDDDGTWTLAGVCPALWLSRSSAEYFYAGTVDSSGDAVSETPCPDRPVYTVTFASDGGSAVSSQIVKTGSTIQEPEPPTREGYTFLGWYQGEEKWDFTKEMTAEGLPWTVPLTAKWQENAAHVHSWDAGEITKPPTCAEKGVKTFHCQGCEETKTENIPATGEHSWNEGTVTKEATCAQPGERTFTCQNCPATKTEGIPATGAHTWNEGEITTEATCVKEGEKTFTCQECPATKTEKIEATGEHRWDAGTVTKEPTATQAGEKAFICQDCPATKTESIPATEACSHDWGEGTVTKEATCAQPGERTYTCKNCQETKTEPIAPIGVHAWNGGVRTKEPTCAQPGERTFACQNCQETKTEPIPATGEHRWDAGRVTTEPTATEAGVKTFTCQDCPATKTEPIPATGVCSHAWDAGTVTEEATCAQPGKRTYICQNCQVTKTEEIPATGEHAWDEDECTTEPTCTEDGEQTFRCQDCETTKTEPIPATGHKWDKGKVTTKATCKKTGTKTFVCQTCKETRTEKIPSNGVHSFGKYKTVKRATVTAKGLKTRKCTVCQKTESVSMPKLTPTLKLNTKSIILRTGQATTKVRVSGLAYGDKDKSWRSSDKKIVKVTKSGKIRAHKKTGRAILTVTLRSGKKATVRVRVQKGTVKTVKISGLPRKATLKAGKRSALRPLITPITSTQKITYTTSDKKVAAVNKKGVITAKKAGKAKITVRSGKQRSVIILTVKR